MSYECKKCRRICDIMTDGFNEFLIGGATCDKCEFDEWTDEELRERRSNEQLVSECGCSGGCEWCLMVERRSFR